MKKKFEELFSRLKKKENYYYFTDEEFTDEDIVNLKPEKELKLLRKENKALKQSFFQQSVLACKTRRSIRKFSHRPFDFEELFTIIDAAMNAPCAGNLQNYRVIYCTKKKDREMIAKMSLDQMWIADAPVVLVIVRDSQVVRTMYPQDGEKFAIQNVAAFIQNIIQLVHVKGLATCWVGACEEEPLKEYLSIPDNFDIDAILPIGYPMETAKCSKLEVSDLFYYDKFKNRIKK
jgi:nitroreductase